MQTFYYRAKRIKDGELVSGLIEAESETVAGLMLEEKDMSVLSLEERKDNFFSKFNDLIGRVKAKDLVMFSRQLSVLISADVRLVEALHDINRQSSNKKLQMIIAQVASEVEGGAKFSEALAHYPKVFDNFFVNIIKSGEASGRLEEVLLYLADQLEKDYDLRSKIKGAMIYPAFIISGLIIIGVFMMIFVVPKLTEMLDQTGAQLPLSTRILEGISNFLINYWWLLIIVIILIVFGLRTILKTRSGKKLFDTITLRLPVLGTLFNYMIIVRFCRSLRTLLLGGVNIVDSLRISQSMIDNLVYKDLIEETVQNVEDGGNISEKLERSSFVPTMVSQMLRTGEDTGKTDLVLDKIGLFYTREIDNLLRNLMSLMEPVIMVVLGLAVGVMIAAIILPMYQISDSMQ